MAVPRSGHYSETGVLGVQMKSFSFPERKVFQCPKERVWESRPRGIFLITEQAVNREIGVPLKINDPLVEFELKGVDNKIRSTSEFRDKKILVVIFTCNHCPYAKAYQDRIIAVQKDYASKGVQIIAINANDDSKYTEDNFENMKTRAREKGFNFPYVRDESQSVAHDYGAKATPHVFVFDSARKLKYVGAIDDNWENPNSAKQKYLRDALDSILANKEVAVKETMPMGCTIKWRS